MVQPVKNLRPGTELKMVDKVPAIAIFLLYSWSFPVNDTAYFHQHGITSPYFIVQYQWFNSIAQRLEMKIFTTAFTVPGRWFPETFFTNGFPVASTPAYKCSRLIQ